ncbi:class I SAM-dependent methyltransferase [Oryzobacter terrae]|uniref:class I SAM-dependent methyltransferase n=1 Tax=Oryzobacter terrae TaxID=1620385 RepID=UPI00366EB0FA
MSTQTTDTDTGTTHGSTPTGPAPTHDGARLGRAPEVKRRHRAMWALGDYPAVAADVVAPLGHVLVDACGIGADDRVLDVAAGSGTVALPAAATGADVTASDLTPELLVVGEQLARRERLDLTWEEADAEALPHDDAEFDVVTSCVGVMFAPFHQPVADELVRVLRPGGRLGLVSWTPTGFIGRMFGVMRPYAPPPPEGAQPPPLWGDEAHVRELLGDRVEDLVATTATLPVGHFADGAAFRDYFKANYGPTIATYRAIADDPEKVAALDEALAALGDAALADGSSGTGSDGTMGWEYLLVTARRA